MPGKTIDPIAATSMEEVRAKMTALFAGEWYEEPTTGIRLKVARLKRREREAIDRACRGDDGKYDFLLQSRMVAAYGIIEPQFADTPERTIALLDEFTDGFIENVAHKVWQLTNDYQDTTAKAADEPVTPFFKRSSGATASASSTDGNSASSTPSTKET